MTCLERGGACLGELESAGGTAELFFCGRCCWPDGKAGGRGSVCGCDFSPPWLSCGLWISALNTFGTPGEREMDED